MTKNPNAKQYIMMFDETSCQQQNYLKTSEQCFFFFFNFVEPISLLKIWSLNVWIVSLLNQICFLQFLQYFLYKLIVLWLFFKESPPREKQNLSRCGFYTALDQSQYQ